MASEPTDQRARIEERATAFVFGELDRDDATEFMKAMNASPEMRATVASIRDAVGAIKVEFEDDTDGVNLIDRRRIEQAMQAPLPEPPPVMTFGPDASTRQWVVGLAVAATLLLACGLTLPALNRVITANTDTKSLRERIRQMESDNKRLATEKQAIENELAAVRATSVGNTESAQQPKPEGDPPEAESIARAEEPVTEKSMAGLQDTGSQDAESFAIQPLLSSAKRIEQPSEPANMDAEKLSQQAARSQSRDGSSQGDVAAAMESGDDATKLDNVKIQGGGYAADEMSVPINSIQIRPLLAQPATPLSNRPRRQRVVAETGGDDSMEMAMGMDAMAGDEMMMGGMGGMHPSMLNALETPGGDQFTPITENSFLSVASDPLSTFSIDVDTASYAKVRMNLSQYNQLPNPDAVRIEELVNYFDYAYAPPEDDRPFAAAMEIAECPWNPHHRLARIGIKGKVVDNDRPASNLVFLLDVSGSMNRPNKLPLVVAGLKMLVNQLGENDSVAIVVYAGAAGLVLDSTTGDRKKIIVDSLQRLRAGGSTNGGRGIQLAYSIARDHFVAGGTNRVILCSDGDFNVGVTGTEQLVKLAEENAKGNIFLTVLGFGTGNHNDAMMEQISNKGNGNYAFIDNAEEARRVLVEQMQGTLVTIAKDVKIQVEFNPMEVESYRLIGYENRILAAADFDDDTIDAGEIGAGHAVTALYEIVPKQTLDAADPGVAPERTDDLKYQHRIRYSEEAANGEMLTLKLRYKLPTGDQSSLIEFAVKDSGNRFNVTDRDFQFAVSVAAFGMLLRNSPHKGTCNYEMVEEIAAAGAEDDRSGYRDEFLSLVKQAKALTGQ